MRECDSCCMPFICYHLHLPIAGKAATCTGLSTPLPSPLLSTPFLCCLLLLLYGGGASAKVCSRALRETRSRFDRPFPCLALTAGESRLGYDCLLRHFIVRPLVFTPPQISGVSLLPPPPPAPSLSVAGAGCGRLGGVDTCSGVIETTERVWGRRCLGFLQAR